MLWWRGRRSRGAEVDRELRDHLDLETEERQTDGAAAEDARLGARRAFGNATLVKEEIREMSGWAWLETLFKDLRYALRTLRANPLFTLTAVLSLALGIGANTAIFTLLHTCLWKPLPVAEPHQIFHLRRGDANGEFGSSYVLLNQLREAAGSGDIFAIAAFGVWKFGTDSRSSERVIGEAV